MIVGVEVPTGLAPDVLGDVLRNLIDDLDWVERALSDSTPDHNPHATSGMHELALLDDAKYVDDDAWKRILDLDRALALKQLGSDDEASRIVGGLPYTAVEVVELVHDAGVARDFAARLGSLVELASAWHEDRSTLEALRDDIADPESASESSSGAEIPLREALDIAPPPGFLAGERGGETSLETQERSPLLARRYARLARAAERLPDVDPDEFGERLIRALPRDTEQQIEMADKVHAAFLEAFKAAEQEPAPMLSELVIVLLMTRLELSGALKLALARDEGTST